MEIFKKIIGVILIIISFSILLNGEIKIIIDLPSLFGVLILTVSFMVIRYREEMEKKEIFNLGSKYAVLSGYIIFLSLLLLVIGDLNNSDFEWSQVSIAMIGVVYGYLVSFILKNISMGLIKKKGNYQ